MPVLIRAGDTRYETHARPGEPSGPHAENLPLLSSLARHVQILLFYFFLFWAVTTLFSLPISAFVFVSHSLRLDLQTLLANLLVFVGASITNHREHFGIRKIMRSAFISSFDVPLRL